MALFGDTFYYLALLNVRDGSHDRALEITRELDFPVVTTEFVLVEVADALGEPGDRAAAGNFLKEISREPETEVIPCSHELFVAGSELYRSRSDKGWSLTDCISFVVMRERKISEALTHDHHFKQAGFRVLL